MLHHEPDRSKTTPAEIRGLSGAELKRLHQRLLLRYPKRAELERDVRFELDARLDEISSENNTLSEVVFNLIKWAEAKGKVGSVMALVDPQRGGGSPPEPDPDVSTSVATRLRIKFEGQLEGWTPEMQMQFFQTLEGIGITTDKFVLERIRAGSVVVICRLTAGIASQTHLPPELWPTLKRLGALTLETIEGRDLTSGEFQGADLTGLDLRFADLTAADLRGANLRSANLDGARLQGAQYDTATVWPAGFSPEKAGAVQPAQDPSQDHWAFDGAARECDLVMKGGITSGVVYPGAVQQLHAAGYRFRSIGGTSAGAIAAGLTAAAQCGGPEGFARLKEVSDQLAQEGFLLSLFQPSTPEAKLVFSLVEVVAAKASLPHRVRTAIGMLGHLAKVRRLQGAVLGVAAGALPLLAVAGLGTLFRLDPTSGLLAALAGGVLGGIAGYQAGKALGSVEALPRLVQSALAEESGFGLCHGHATGAVAAENGQLTDWLGWALDYVAGKTSAAKVAAGSKPLTMRDLTANGVDFRAMTSNLSEGQPYPLPFEKKNLLFNAEEMRRFFPPHVVDHMVATAHRGDFQTGDGRGKLPDGYHFLPFGDDFPVLLAVRMSLSFPVLISALPLYKLAPSGWAKLREGSVPDPRSDLRRHWFSDGGLSSNFPIHFFDAWVPSRPTFGINLVSAPAGQDSPDPALQRPNPPSEPDVWTELTGLGAFFNAIWSTAQNFRDNMQSQLPSYRERIVPVALSPDEGGLNLKMPRKVVEAVMQRGEQAGEALAGFKMDEHLWVRYLVLMKVLEENLMEFGKAVGPGGSEFKALCQRQLAAAHERKNYPYARDEQWCEEAGKRIEQLEACLRGWGETHFDDSPKPESALRVTPRV